MVSTCGKAADVVQSQAAALKCGVLLWLHQRISAPVTHCCYLYRIFDSVFGSRTTTLAGSYRTGSHGTDSRAFPDWSSWFREESKHIVTLYVDIFLRLFVFGILKKNLFR